MNSVFFGSSSYVLPIIEMLQEKYHLSLVVTTEKNPADPVVAFCNTYKIPFISVTSQKELLAMSDKLQATKSPVGILADFRIIVPQSLIDSFPKGIINIHPSLLPEYRGPTPGTTALLDGKTTTGVSIMLLVAKMDAGPLLGQIKDTIFPTDTSATLYPRLFEKGAKLLEDVLPKYLDGTLAPLPQDDAKATYTNMLTRNSGYIDPSKPPASPQQLEQMIRALYPWPGVWTTLRVKGKGLRIKFLPEKKIQVEGKKAVSYKDFINGYPEGKELLEKLGLL